MAEIIRLTDRSRTVQDWKCQRSRFFLTEYAGKGIVRAASTTELDFGTDEHDALEELARRIGEADVVGDIAPRLYRRVFDREAQVLGEGPAVQLASIAEGSFRGFCRVVWPQILRDYDIVAVEQECLKTLTPWLKFMARPDLIVRSKAAGTYWYVEYKTTSWVDDRWINSWQKAVQTHSGCMAAEETLGIQLEGCIVQGIYKGYRKDGFFRSPYAEGWRYLLGPTVEYSYTYMRNKGWEKFSPTDLDGGVAQWIELMPEDLLMKQFPRTPPIFVRREMCEKFFDQLVNREYEIRDAITILRASQSAVEADQIMNDVFPQNFDACTPSFGKHDCPFLDCCWSRVGDDPLASGAYKRREPHHQPEVDLYAKSYPY